MFNDETLLTYPSRKLFNLLIGDNHYCPIPSDLAEIIIAQTKNSSESGYFVQTESGPDETLLSPRLWHYRFWVTTNAQWARRRKWSEHERELRFIFDANVKQIARAYSDECDVPIDIAHTTAYKLLSRNKHQQIKALGVELYTTIGELP